MTKKPSKKPVPKSASKLNSKTSLKTKAPAKKPAKVAMPKPIVAKKAEAPKVERTKPALMTSRGKVKDAPITIPAVVPTAAKGKAKTIATVAVKTDAEIRATNAKNFDNNGDQLIAMAKEEMSKINRTADSDKSDKPGKFKPIKIERGNLSDEKAKWQELNKRYSKEKALNYKMTDTFESLRPIQHKVLGWGFILSNDNNRLEVLFENGIKMLISNYKPN